MSVALVMQDRRNAKRLVWQMPVSITTLSRPERACVTRDVSATGMLLDSEVPFALGEEVTVTFHVGKGPSSATGYVVRVARAADNGQMANVTAVRFESPVGKLSAPN
jgi:hypothetical protein